MAYPPAAAPMAPELPPLEMSQEDVTKWWSRVKLARDRRKRELSKWERLMRNYMPPATPNDDINSNVHFRNVHLKIAEVFAQFPELQLTPLEPLLGIVDPATGQPFVNPQTQQPMDPTELADHIVSVKRAVLIKLLGPDYADADQTILEALFDIFNTSGIGATELCYEADIKEVEQEMPGAPVSAPGSVLGLSEVPGEPTVTTVPVVVNERILWDHFSPAAFLQPHDNHGTRWDDVCWLGREFQIPFTPSNAKALKLPPDFNPPFAPADALVVSHGYRDATESTASVIRGIRIWMHARDYDPDVVDKDVFYKLVLVEGLSDQAAVYERSPHQSVGPDGRLTADSLLGNPIHPITLRVATDTAWIPSDSAFTDPLVRQENTWLSQAVKMRDANISRFVHPASATEAIDKMKLMDTGQGVAIPDDLFAQFGQNVIVPVPHLENSRSDTEGHAMIRRSMDETLGTRNQAATVNSGRVSATESAVVDRNISVRLKGEQKKLMKAILQGVRKFDTLAMRYLSPQFVQLAGQAGAQLLVMVNRQMITVRCQYDAHPDTMVTTDADALQAKWLKWTNFMAKSPNLQQLENARNGALAFGYDPTKLIAQPPPPPEPPPEAKVSVALKAEDLALPEARILLKATGIDLGPVSPEAVMLHLAAQQKQNENQPHGGAADKADLLSEHQSERTGAQDGQPPLAPAPPMTQTPGAQLH